jgi:putative transposase
MFPETHMEGRGRPCTHSKREIIDAILYIVRGGIPWRMIPNDLPHWKTVYHYFRLWAKLGIWQKVHDAIRDMARLNHGKKKPQLLRSSTVKAFAQLAKPEYVAMMRARKWLEENDTPW